MSLIKLPTKKVLKACIGYKNWREARIEAALDRIRQKYAKRKKFIFFGGPMWTAEEIENIIDGNHWWYGDPLFKSHREAEEWKGCLIWDDVASLGIAAKSTNCDTMEVSVEDFNKISAFYELQS